MVELLVVLALDDLVLAVTLIAAQMTCCWGFHIAECLNTIGSIDKNIGVALCQSWVLWVMRLVE